MFVFTQGLHALVIRQDAREKRHSKFGLHGDHITLDYEPTSDPRKKY